MTADIIDQIPDAAIAILRRAAHRLEHDRVEIAHHLAPPEGIAGWHKARLEQGGSSFRMRRITGGSADPGSRHGLRPVSNSNNKTPSVDVGGDGATALPSCSGAA